MEGILSQSLSLFDEVDSPAFALSSGTSGNMVAARELASWVKYLDTMQQVASSAVPIYSQLIKFSFANTHRGSLDTAFRIVEEALENAPGIHVPIARFEFGTGKGCKNLEEGKDVWPQLEEYARPLVEKCQLFLPTGNIGQGNTGTSTELKLVKLGLELKKLTTPLIIKSSPEELDWAHQVEVKRQFQALGRMGVWAMVADNDFFSDEDEKYNIGASLQDSVNRIDYVASHSRRNYIMLFTHPMQIDESKLEGQIFSGNGGFVRMGGVPVNVNNLHSSLPEGQRKAELDRMVQLLVNTPFIGEVYPEIDIDFSDNVFDSLVIGLVGNVPASASRAIIQRIRQHPHVAKHLNRGATLSIQRIAPYLPAELTSVFVMMNRQRPGERAQLFYPSREHHVLKALRELEIRSDGRLTAEAALPTYEVKPLDLTNGLLEAPEPLQLNEANVSEDASSVQQAQNSSETENSESEIPELETKAPETPASEVRQPESPSVMTYPELIKAFPDDRLGAVAAMRAGQLNLENITFVDIMEWVRYLNAGEGKRILNNAEKGELLQQIKNSPDFRMPITQNASSFSFSVFDNPTDIKLKLANFLEVAVPEKDKPALEDMKILVALTELFVDTEHGVEKVWTDRPANSNGTPGNTWRSVLFRSQITLAERPAVTAQAPVYEAAIAPVVA